MHQLLVLLFTFTMGATNALGFTRLNFKKNPGGLRAAMPGATATKTGLNEFEVIVDGDTSKNGKYGQLVYDKILKDQKELFKRQPAPGFRPGTLPAFVLPRIKYASVRELCKELCKAALEESGIQPDEDQEHAIIRFPGVETAGDVTTFCQLVGYKPGMDVTFSATRVRGSEPGIIFADMSENRSR